MKILGIHFQSHDASAVMIEDGKVTYAASNERFSRKKMDPRVPLKALDKCLKYTKTKPDDLDLVVFTGNSFPLSYVNMLKDTTIPLVATRGKYLLWLKKPHYIIQQLLMYTGIPSYLYRILLPEIRIRLRLKGYTGKYYYSHHHMAHLYSAYYTSGWKNCLVMCAEGSGFTETFSIFQVKNDEWIKVAQAKLPHSAGKFYEFVTEILGFNRYRHPGKITGLAGYGNYKKAYKYVKDFLRVEGIDLKFDYEKHMKGRAYYYLHKKPPKELEKYSREDIAAAFQKRLEECIVEVLRKALKKTGENRVAFAGGVAANVKLNQRIHEIPEVKELHIHQAMGDDGLAMGAAMHVAYLNGEKIERPSTVYFGPDFLDKEIEKVLKKYKLKYQKEKDIEKQVAKILTQKKVVARFNGRMEYGPRALGNRSILYEAKDESVNDWLNKRLKRTEFMPFAPVTLDEYADKCFKNLRGAEYPSRFMTITFDCTSYMKRTSPACVHVDGTARPQILRRQDNPSYYRILSEYHKLTGIPTLVNTSFNMHEEPIVCTPEEAVRSFLVSEIDFLAIGSFLVSFKDNANIAKKVQKRPIKKNKSILERFSS